MLRRLVLGMFVASALAACGPSAAQIHTARTARYQVELPAAYAAVLDALTAQHYQLRISDRARGLFVTTSRYYEPDGTTSGEHVDAGAINFGLAVEVSGDETCRAISILPVATLRRGDGLLRDPLATDDPRLPGWVEGKIDSLYVAIHARLKDHAVTPRAVATASRR